MEELRFIHTADLHLGSPFKGMAGLSAAVQKELQDSTFRAFDRLISYACDTLPDFMLIAGDVYDGEDRSLRAQHRFQQGMEELQKAGVPVVLCHGNHDHLSGKWIRFELPDNVHTFGPEVSTHRLVTAKGAVHVSGFSYGERHVRERLIDAYPESDGSGWHIGMLHGSMDGDQSHAVYAPFSKSQLLGKNYDYWALGHIHMRQVLHEQPPIVYPGNIQGRHRNESGVKGFYEVTLAKGAAQLAFVESSAVLFGTVPVACSGTVHMNELIDICLARLAEFAADNGSSVVEIRLTAADEAARELLLQIDETELRETLRESAGTEGDWIWIERIRFDALHEDAGMPAIGEQLMEALASWEQAEWKDSVKDLYRHPKAARFLEPLDEKGTEEIMEKARDYMHRRLRERE